MAVTRGSRNNSYADVTDQPNGVGYVRDVGTFLQDQLVYSEDFFERGIMVGCRQQELQLDSDPWIPTRFEFRDKVTPRLPLAVRGES